MASTYGLHFGFRISDESSRNAHGRFRTPKVGSPPPNDKPLLIGSCVQLEDGADGGTKGAAAGYLTVADADAAPVPGYCGVLLQEEDHLRSIYQTEGFDYPGTGIAKPDTLSVITNGAGTKVWFKNVEAKTRVDGHATPAINLVEFTPALVTGAFLGWGGDANNFRWRVVADEAIAHFVVTEANTDKQYAEAVFLK